MRRKLAADEVSLAAARARQKELDQFLLAAPAAGWVEAVAKARYLLILLAQTPAAETAAGEAECGRFRRLRAAACRTDKPARHG